MLVLKVQVATTRDRAGVAILRDGSKTVMTGPVVASATQAIAARRANPDCDPLRVWGHPPFGGYRLLHHVEARAELNGEYGSHLLLFEPESGQALDAESFGRLALLAYGGPAGRDGRLRRTQGGLRLSNKMLHAIVEKLRAGVEMELELSRLTAPAWWQFWKRPVETLALSGTVPELLSPPVDEASVLEELLLNPALVRRRRAHRERDERRDWDDDDRRERSSSSSDSSSGRDSFRGKGGEGAGAGASGGWDSAPGRNPGVDQAGRIIAGAAAAAGLAAIANEVAGARGEGAGDGSGSGGSAGTSSDTSTTTSTAY